MKKENPPQAAVKVHPLNNQYGVTFGVAGLRRVFFMSVCVCFRCGTGLEGLLEIMNDVVDMLDADRDSDQVLREEKAKLAAKSHK